MTTLRIFLSSVQKEFAAERAALRDYLQGDALMRRFFDVFLFEDVPAADRRADALYLDEVDRCDFYIGLFGDDYGVEDAEGISPTAREFIRASAQRAAQTTAGVCKRRERHWQAPKDTSPHQASGQRVDPPPVCDHRRVGGGGIRCAGAGAGGAGTDPAHAVRRHLLPQCRARRPGYRENFALPRTRAARPQFSAAREHPANRGADPPQSARRGSPDSRSGAVVRSRAAALSADIGGEVRPLSRLRGSQADSLVSGLQRHSVRAGRSGSRFCVVQN